jgi:hypothetical protein
VFVAVGVGRRLRSELDGDAHQDPSVVASTDSPMASARALSAW